MTDEKIIDKLCKLKAMADSAGKVGNEAEAQAFAQMVQTLLAKHKIDASEVEWEQELTEDLIRALANPNQATYATWELDLAGIIAKASCCRSLFKANGRKKVKSRVDYVSFYGSKADVEGAQLAFVYLQAAAKHLAEREYVKYFNECKERGDVTQARGYKASWLVGFIYRLGQRYRENEVAIRSAAAVTALVRISQALARVNQLKAKVVVVDDREIMNETGFRHGKQAANRVRLANDPAAAAGQLK